MRRGSARDGAGAAWRREALRAVVLWWTLVAPFVVALLLLGLVDGAARLFSASGSPPGPELPVLPLILAYAAGGLLAGLVLQVLWRPGIGVASAAASGFAAAIPFFLAIRVAVLGPFGWTPGQILGLGLRALFGVVVGLVLWRTARSGRDPIAGNRHGA